MFLHDKTLLLTGGTGSFGQKFTEIALKQLPKSIRVFSRSEHLQQEMSNRFSSDILRFFIGDVRDKDRLHRAMSGVDYVIHAAALKQVPTCEYNPREAVLTNIMGATNLIDTAIDSGVKKVIAISSDKACQPLNLYGATKLVMEKLLTQANVYSKDTVFGCVRYGNVVGSKGSVIPLFLEQQKRGYITITDTRMTRFWITLEQGAEFVISCLEKMSGGEIFVPKIPSMKLTDLADTVVPNTEKIEVGIRSGEKLNEVLITEDESRRAVEFDSYYVIPPEFPFWNLKLKGKQLPEGFAYTSDTNTQWLDSRTMSDIVSDLLIDKDSRHKRMIDVLENDVKQMKSKRKK